MAIRKKTPIGEITQGIPTNSSRWSTDEGIEYKKNIEAFIKAGGPIIDFQIVGFKKLFGMIEDKLDLAGIELTGAEFCGCEVKNALFNEALISGNFSDVKLTNVSLKSCDLADSILYNVNISEGTTFDESNITKAQITNLRGLSDKSLSSPFEYSSPSYFRIVGKLVFNRITFQGVCLQTNANFYS